ncbi:mavicyanin-like [Curcuma longa]|uniref:mavicyanin-like n=1 Tax=Curcuma longa TaxID=136217 RepID=UPI003D9E774A
MAKRATSLTIAGLILVAASFFSVFAAATTHVVGDSTGWTIPPGANGSFYSAWASARTFAVGDTLVFNFMNSQHDVVEVPMASFNSCSTANQIGSTYRTSPASLPVATAGVHYYICGFSGHCQAGQRLAVTVTSSSACPPDAAAAPPTATATGGGSTVPSAPGPGSQVPGSAAAWAPSLASLALSSLLASQFLF